MATDAVGAPLRAPIEEGFFADVRGVPQWITLRGADRANPALLMLSGPGAAFSGLAPFFAPWEGDWTLVQWDQPGAGATFARNGELPLSLDRLAADAPAVAEIACARLGVARLVVLGMSGGSILGLKLAQARPDLVTAYVGTGQIVHWARQAARGYGLALAAAQGRGDGAAMAALEAAGPPPYADIQCEMAAAAHVNVLTEGERAGFAEVAALKTPVGASWVPAGLALPDPRARGLAGYLAVRDEIAAFDAKALGTRFEVPIGFLQGSEDLYTPTPDVADYTAAISAPAVRLEMVAGGGHSSVFMRTAFLEAFNHLFETIV